MADLENIVVDVRNGRPILIKDVAKVQFGKLTELRMVPVSKKSRIVSAAMLAAGCASKVPLEDKSNVPVETRSGTAGGGGGAGGAGAGAPQSQVTTVNTGAGGAATSAPRTIYFDFDSYTVKDEFKNFYTLDGTLIKSLIDIESDLNYLVACCDKYVPVKLEQAIQNYTKRDNI